LKVIRLPFLSEKSPNFDESWCSEADFNSFTPITVSRPKFTILKIQRWRTDTVLEIVFCQNLAAGRPFGKLLYRETESHIDEGHMT